MSEQTEQPKPALFPKTPSAEGRFEVESRGFFAFDTNCRIKAAIPRDAATPVSCRRLNEALDEAVGLCYRYERMWSHTREGSDIWRLNHAQGRPVTVSRETVAILKAARHYYEETVGLFDIAMAPVAELWNHHRAQVPSTDEIARALETVKVGQPRVAEDYAQLPTPESKVSLGGIAKGHIADRVGELFEKRQILHALIDLGGNIVIKGEPFLGKEGQAHWSVGIRSPLHALERNRAEKRAAALARSPHGIDLRTLRNKQMTAEQPACILELNDCSIVTSSIYERCFADEKGMVYHHIADPRTGRPSESDLASATVISKRSIDGDGLSTALLLMGSDWAAEYVEEHPGIEAVLITRDGDLLPTSGIRKALSNCSR